MAADNVSRSVRRGSVYSDRALADMAIVQEAMDDWRIHNDPADPNGSTMAEFVVNRLYAHRRLS